MACCAPCHGRQRKIVPIKRRLSNPLSLQLFRDPCFRGLRSSLAVRKLFAAIIRHRNGLALAKEASPVFVVVNQVQLSVFQLIEPSQVFCFPND